MSSIDGHPLTSIGSTAISGESPCGENARYDSEFELLEAELSKQESLSSATVDWAKVVDLSASLISTRSKDILVASYLCYALLLKEGYTGLAVGLKILNDMAETHWDCLFPPLKRLRARQTAYVWLAEKAGLILAEKVPSNNEYEVIISAAEILKQLDNTLVDKMGDQAPMLSDLSRPLKNYLQSAKAEQEKIQQSQAAAPEPAAAEPATPAETTPPEAEQPAPAAVKQPAAKKSSASAQAISTGAIESEADSKKTLRQLQAVSRDISGFWVKQKLSDPRAYRLSRVAAWMVVENVPPSNEGVTQINPPPAERLKFFETTMEKSDYATLVIELEKTIARAPFWLDGHFLVVKALRALGAEYDKATQTVIRETANFLNRLPELVELSFSDQSPFASDQTKMWLTAEVLTTGASGGNSAAGGDSGAEAWDAALAEASKIAAGGDTDQAVSMMQLGLQQAGPQRDQMYWRCALAQLLMQLGNAVSAASILEQLSLQLDEDRVATWEPKLLSLIYNLLFQSYQKQSKKKKDDEKLKENLAMAYEKLCWFDPVTALSVKGG